MMRTSLLLALLVVVGAKDSKVLVHVPFQLHNATGLDHVKAEFGFSTVSAGRSLAEYVYFVEATLCNPLTNQTEGFPTHDSLKGPFILMVEEGGACSAVTKARHAQHAGASALLIAATQCLCSDIECIGRFNDTTCATTDPVLVNDGSGSDISIPSFLIFKTLATSLKEKLEKNQPCLVELQWGLQEEDIGHSQPKFQFWTTAYDPLVSLESYVELRTVTTAFKDYASFAPRYSLIDGHRFQCNSEPDENAPCDHLCTNHGRYCTLHAKDLSGYAIVKETLRRLCIWKHFGEQDNNKFWDYIMYHKEMCSDPHEYADQKCVDEGLKIAKIDIPTLSSCMEDAGNIDQDNANSLLEDMLHYQSRSGVVSLPALAVNSKVLKHTSARSLFETICTEYWLSGIDKIPAVCETCSACPNAVGCVEKGHCVEFSNQQRHPSTGYSHKKKGHGWRIFWSLVAAMAMAGGAWYYYDTHRADFAGRGTDRVGLMNDYLQLSGES